MSWAAPFIPCIFALALVGTSASSSSGLSTRDCLVNKIFCEASDCIGSDQGCYNHSNTQVGGAGGVYRIRNAEYPEWYLELRRGDNRWISAVGKGRERAAGKNFQWTIMKLPSQTASSSYMMFTERLRDHAMTYDMMICHEDSNVTSGEVSGAATTAEQQNVGWASEGVFNISARYGYAYCANALVGVSTKIDGPLIDHKEVTLKFTKAPTSSGNPSAPLIMISSVSHPNEFLQSLMGEIVRAAKFDPGFSGYWFFDPPLPSAELEAMPGYAGQRCSSECGKMGSIDDIGKVYINKASAASSLSLFLLLLTLLGERR